MGKEYNSSEVAKHNSPEDCWLIVGNDGHGGPKVYDVTQYLDDHPGGAEVLLDVAGQDADEFFEDIGHSDDARKELKEYLIGTLKLDAEEIEKRNTAKNASSSGSDYNMIILLVVLI